MFTQFKNIPVRTAAIKQIACSRVFDAQALKHYVLKSIICLLTLLWKEMLFIINKNSSKNNWGQSNLLNEHYRQGVTGLQGRILSRCWILSRSGAGCLASWGLRLWFMNCSCSFKGTLALRIRIWGRAMAPVKSIAKILQCTWSSPTSSISKTASAHTERLY